MSASGESKPVIKLPERETYLANAILRCLREWEERRKPGPPFIVTKEDLNQLETWAAGLWKTWQITHDMAERDGFEIILQPSAVFDRSQHYYL